MTLRIRDATPDDQEFIAAGNEAMALETEHKHLDRATVRLGVGEALRNRAHGRYFVAEDGSGTRVGQLMITYEWSDWRNGQFWWLQSVHVIPPARGRGVFKAMYEHVEALARATPGVIGLRLYVEGDNARAQRSYARCGMDLRDYRFMEVDYSGALDRANKE
jgi:ribosomal protein S18 acetylase RimI-like enzyme